MGDRVINNPLIVIDHNTLSTFHVNEGDTVVIGLPPMPGIEEAALIQHVLDQIKGLFVLLGIQQSTLLIIPKGITLESLDDEAMASAGWVRKGEDYAG